MTASATINGTPVTLTFSALATGPAPQSIVPVTNRVGTTPVGVSMPGSSYPRVRLLDGQSAPVPNYPVEFAAIGACTLSSPVTVLTDAAGEAAVSPANLSFGTAQPAS